LKSSNLLIYFSYLRFFAKIGFFLFFAACFNDYKNQNPFLNNNIVVINPFYFQNLDGKNIPIKYFEEKNIALKLAQNEQGFFSFLIYARKDLNKIKIEFDDLKSDQEKISKTAFDACLIKVWFQASNNSITSSPGKKSLIPELLLKDDSLIIVDEKKEQNFLRIKNREDRIEHINISEKEGVSFKKFNEALVEDSKELKEFSINKNRYKQIFVKVNLPAEVKSGIYYSKVKIYEGSNLYDEMPIQLQVINLSLPESDLIIGIFYEGILSFSDHNDFGHKKKSPKQYEIELRDIFNSGIMYPTFKEPPEKLGDAILVRRKIGFKLDKIFITGTVDDFLAYPDKITEEKLLSKVDRYKDEIKKIASECEEIFISGYDEASVYNKKIYILPELYKKIKEKGVKIFCAISSYPGNFEIMKNILDAPILMQKSYIQKKEDWLSEKNVLNEIKLYKGVGSIVLSYANPQVGIENPELYRRNYGLGLFFYGYDGCMNFAYQRQFGKSIWNDFDAPLIKNKFYYRDHVFAYPIARGIISTIQYEGFKKGIIDLRYLKLLQSKLSENKNEKKDELKNELKNIQEKFLLSKDIYDDFEKLILKVLKQ